MFYFVIFHCYLVGPCSFLIRDIKGVDPDGRGSEEELREVREKKMYSDYIVWEKNLCLMKEEKEWGKYT